MRIRISLKLILFVIIVVVLFSLLPFIYKQLKPVKSINYHNQVYVFRDDVRKANKVPVYPNEDFVHDLFWNRRIKNITIMFKPMDSKTNARYGLEAFELTYKLSQMYASTPITKVIIYNKTQYMFFKRNFTAQPIDDYEDITREDDVLKIILVPPQLSDGTYVRGGGNKIFIYGKDFRGLDLATIKTILVAMKKFNFNL